MTRLKIVWSGPLEDTTGYATEGRLIVRGLREKGLSVTARSMQREDLLRKGIQYPSFSDVDVDAASMNRVHIVHAAWADPFPSVPAGKTVWRTMFETDSLPAAWVDRSRKVDEIWVPSQHNVDTFSSAGVSREKIRVLHEPLDIAAFSSVAGDSGEGIRTGEFILLSVFTWQLRKGWDILLRAYFEEFSAADGVLLILRCDPFLHGGISKDSILHEIEGCRRKFGGGNPPALKLLEDHVGDRELVDLYASSDAFVLPSRGEGWSRPVMEAMALGVPVITTGWGGQTEFADSESVRLLEYDIVPVSSAAEREYSLFAGHRWAEPSLAHLRREMRAALAQGKGFRDRQSAAKILASFNHLRIAQDILDLLMFPGG